MRLLLAAYGLGTIIVLLTLGIGQRLPAERIIFLSDRDGLLKLYAMDIGRGLIHKLNDAEIAWEYTLSFDRQHIVYRQAGGEHPAILVMDFSGHDTHPLVDQPGINPAWSPDSQYITFTKLDQDDHPTQIYRINADGTDVRRLTDLPNELQAYAAFWSPDGRQIMFQVAAARNKLSLYLMGADGSDAHPLSIPIAFDALVNPAWSPDGRYIAFVGQSVNSAQAVASTLCVMEMATAEARCSDSNIYNPFSWSPDSASIAFISTKGYHNYEVKILDVQTAQTRSILRYGKNDRVSSVGYPIWTADAQHLIYAVSNGGQGQTTELHVVGTDGGGERSLTSDSFTNILPTGWPGDAG
jgi:Tol biopolymer transport system component